MDDKGLVMVKISDELKAEIAILRNAYSPRQIAAHTGVSRTTIRSIDPIPCDLEDVPWIPTRLRPDELHDEVLHQLKGGRGAAEIAPLLGITVGTVEEIARTQ